MFVFVWNNEYTNTNKESAVLKMFINVGPFSCC
jgi:hypothetical protein